jgi:lipopolysaccharide export system protein LptC
MARPRLGRYSRAVRILRVALPLVALALMSTIFLFTRDTLPPGIRFSAKDFAALEDGLRLSEPRFTGTTDAGEPFVVSAEWALPDSADPTEIRLHAIRASIAMADGRTAELTAADGMLRPKAQTVALTGGVRLTTSDGYVAETETAEADLRARTLVAPGAVMAEGPLGRIEAGRLDMVRPDPARDPDAEELIVFQNRVRVVYRPADAEPGK